MTASVQTVTVEQVFNTLSDAAGALASGWTDAATRYGQWLAAESATRVVSATEKLAKYQTEFKRGFEIAQSNASTWAQAAQAQGNNGTAAIMQKYADRFASEAARLSGNVASAEANLAGLVGEIKVATQAADKHVLGAFSRALGPGFDALQMASGAADFYNTGNSDKLGGAAAGVILSTLGAAFGAGFAAVALTAGAPVIILGGLGAIAGSTFGAPVYEWLRDNLRSSRAFMDAVITIGDATNGFFGLAQAFQPQRDPLVLDLDGDGLELVSASSSTLFDHNADGIRTATGWVSADDGLLVRDINQNGTIDSGRELFGVDTLKLNGQLAVHGFDALSDLDSNLDGLVNALDDEWNQLKVWRDLNQDGVSQATELKTLAELSISKLS